MSDRPQDEGQDSEIEPATGPADNGPPPDEDAAPPREVGLIPLEELTDPPDGATEPCPSCGALLRGDEGLVCLRCGYDLKAMSHHETEVGGTTEADEEDEGAEPLVQPGRGGVILPAVIAAVGMAALIVGFLAGWIGLFPNLRPDADTGIYPDITFMQRLQEAARGIALIGVWSGGAMAALLAMAAISARTFGDVRLAVARILGVIVVVRLATFIELHSTPLEVTLEMLVQIPAFVVLVMVLFGQHLRDAALMLAITIIAVVGIWFLGVIVTTIGVV